jgi:hypothetical protein
MPATNPVSRKVTSVERKYLARLEGFGGNHERRIGEVHGAVGVQIPHCHTVAPGWQAPRPNKYLQNYIICIYL